MVTEPSKTPAFLSIFVASRLLTVQLMTNSEVFPILHGGFTAAKKTEPAPNSDLALAISAGKGDMEAFEKLYERHNRRVYSLCLRMTQNGAEAEDLAQEAFIQLFRKIGSFRGESAFTTWLHRLVVNQCLMHFRKRSVKLKNDRRRRDARTDRPRYRKSERDAGHGSDRSGQRVKATATGISHGVPLARR
jgi:hypothetical protein